MAVSLYNYTIQPALCLAFSTVNNKLPGCTFCLSNNSATWLLYPKSVIKTEISYQSFFIKYSLTSIIVWQKL